MQYARTLWELMERRVDATPDALMAVDEDMGTLTFAEFWAEAELAAAGLAAAGVGAGDVVTWQLPTWIESLVLVAALSRLDVAQNPLPLTLGSAELEAITTRVGTSLLVTPSVLHGVDHETVATAVARRHGAMRVLLADRALPQGDPVVLGRRPVGALPEDQEVRFLFATAGTTAGPKIVRHTDASMLAAARGLCRRLGLIGGDRVAFIAPVTHVTGVVWLLATLESGCASIVCDPLDTERAVEVLAREGVTLAGSDSALHSMYLERQRRQIEPLFPSVRAFVGSGAERSQDLADEVRSVFGVPVLWGYGSTEAPNVTMTSMTDPDDVLRGTEGAPVHGVELRFVGLDGRLCDPGQIGEIRLRAPQLMRGYLDPSLNRTAFDDDGFFCTGDLGFLDDTGNLVVTGRTDEIVVRRGGSVPVKVLEQLLRDDLPG